MLLEAGGVVNTSIAVVSATAIARGHDGNLFAVNSGHTVLTKY